MRILRPADDVSDFDCGDEGYQTDVADFLRENALVEQQRGLNATYLFHYKGERVGFASILASHLQVEDEPGLSELEVGRNLFPAMLIGQFATAREHQGRGLGGEMLRLLRGHALDLGIGIRLLTLQVARDNRPARAFWERHGFRPVLNLSGRNMLFRHYDLYQSADE